MKRPKTKCMTTMCAQRANRKERSLAYSLQVAGYGVATITLAILASVSQSFADFSQLDFDDAVRQRHQASEKKTPKNDAKKNPVDTKQKQEPEPKGFSLPFPPETKSYEDSPLFVTPRIRGPWVDKDDDSKITSDRSWKAKATSCGEPGPDIEYVNKAIALKEVLNRLTGNNDFFLSQCSFLQCPSSDLAPALVGLALASTRGGAFRFVPGAEERSCHYQLERPSGGHWLALTAGRATCVCLPKDKLQ